MTAPHAGAGVTGVAGPTIGEPAPDFTLANQFGEPVQLSALRGQPVAVVFYPFAFSGICTGELCELRDNLASFTAEGVKLLAVSVDSKFTLRAFARTEGYEFDLLSDFWPHGAAARAYSVFDAASGIALRGTFIIDAQGILRHSLINPRGQARTLSDYHAGLAALRT